MSLLGAARPCPHCHSIPVSSRAAVLRGPQRTRTTRRLSKRSTAAGAYEDDDEAAAAAEEEEEDDDDDSPQPAVV